MYGAASVFLQFKFCIFQNFGSYSMILLPEFSLPFCKKKQYLRCSFSKVFVYVFFQPIFSEFFFC